MEPWRNEGVSERIEEEGQRCKDVELIKVGRLLAMKVMQG